MGSALAGAATLAGRGLLGLVQLDVNHCRRLAKEDDSHQDATLSVCKPPHSALNSAGVGRNCPSHTLLALTPPAHIPQTVYPEGHSGCDVTHRPGRVCLRSFPQ